MEANVSLAVRTDKVRLGLYFAPPVTYFVYLTAFPCVLDLGEHFAKQSYHSRCHILGPQGVEELVVPVSKGAHSHCPLREVLISEHNTWRAKALSALKSYYKLSPYYDHYIGDIAPIIAGAGPYLAELNLMLIERVAELLRVPLMLRVEESYCGDDRGLFSPDIHPKHPSPFAATSYYQAFSHKLPFQPDLSILDLLFSLGPHARPYLRALHHSARLSLPL